MIKLINHVFIRARPCSRPPRQSDMFFILDCVFLSVFFLEFVLKTIASGFLWTKQPYLRDAGLEV